MDFNLPEDLRLMQAAIKKYVDQVLEPAAVQIEEEDAVPEDVVEGLREMGLFGMSIPEEYGGLGLDTLGECVVYEEISRANASVRTRFSTNNGIGSLGILYDGTPDQREQFLPPIACGEKTIAFALTEPDAGSDASAIRTSAVRDGDDFILNGRKMFITNGAIAELVTVLAVTDPQKKARGGITAFVIEKGTPGFSVGKLEKKMGLKGSGTAELIFEDCRVPVNSIIGGEAMIGKGFRTAMRVLDKGRLTLAAASVGMARRALELAVLYAKQRVQFGKPIGEFQLIQGMLAQMATEILAGQSMVYRVAWQKDQGNPVRKEAAMCKLFCSEMLGRVADTSLQVHGGMGYMKEYAIERIYRDARVTRIYEGTSEIQKLVIARELLNG
ncbi:MAG: acyl-CoA dehydrogenase family protein [Proteobacteria bacterium]|nr:acyl-CoA dehydrogenase family protein [Pseudomonadota bacterium]MBU4597081.1 acyl-CoA dehydrogenase family protein [Pseudomonadota bacterium]MBV1715323.1 acyl-CoA dehydrogenase family protein [Desulfarculus sp.]